jgi:ssDNA-binding Zn-finger/Zn-ribbon topoisomerase 1
LETGKRLQTLEGSAKKIVALPGCDYAVGIHGDGLRVWEIDNGKAIANFTPEHPIVDFAVSPDGGFLLATDYTTVHFLDFGFVRTKPQAAPPAQARSQLATEGNRRCPHCNSHDVKERSALKQSAYVSFLLLFVLSGLLSFYSLWWPIISIPVSLATLFVIVSLYFDTSYYCQVCGKFFFKYSGIHGSLKDIHPRPPVVTAWRSPTDSKIAFGCPFCRTWQEMSADAVGSKTPCPRCENHVRLSHFMINRDWCQMKEAWSGVYRPVPEQFLPYEDMESKCAAEFERVSPETTSAVDDSPSASEEVSNRELKGIRCNKCGLTSANLRIFPRDRTAKLAIIVFLSLIIVSLLGVNEIVTSWWLAVPSIIFALFLALLFPSGELSNCPVCKASAMPSPLERLQFGPPIATAWCSPADARTAFRCPHCHDWSEIPSSALGDEMVCSHCGHTVRLNSFTINADWCSVKQPNKTA